MVENGLYYRYSMISDEWPGVVLDGGDGDEPDDSAEGNGRIPGQRVGRTDSGGNIIIQK